MEKISMLAAMRIKLLLILLKELKFHVMHISAMCMKNILKSSIQHLMHMTIGIIMSQVLELEII